MAFDIFAVLFSPSSLPGAIVNQFGGDIASWAWTELGTLLTGGAPPDTTQTSLNNILAGVTQMEQSIATLNSLLGWDTSAQQADTCEAQLTAYYQEFLTGVDWPTFWQDVTGIGTPGTNSAPNYSASVPYNAMTLNNLLTVQNVNGVGGMIQQAITNQLELCQYYQGSKYVAPWQVTQNVINFMTETMLIQQQAIVVLAAAYGYAQNQGWTSQCALIQGYVNDIAGYLQQQLTIYQQTMPLWLQVLASQSKVNGASGGPIGWAPVYRPPANPADPPAYTPPPPPSGFACAIGYPNNNPGLYAAATPYGGQAKIGACPSAGYKANNDEKQYGFPVCGPSPCSVGYGQPPSSPANVTFIGLTDSTNFSPSMYWYLFPIAGSTGFYMQCASGNNSDKMSLEPTWSPEYGNGTLTALTLGNPSQGAKVWICPAYTSPPSPTFAGWNDIVYIYLSEPGSSPANQWAFSGPFQGCAYWYQQYIGGIAANTYVNADPPAQCPTPGLVVVGGTGGALQFTISIAPVEANPQGTSVSQNVSGPPPMSATWMPTLSSISVTSVAPNSTTPNVVLSGTNLEAATVNSLGSMINFEVTAATSTTMTVTITAASNAQPGPYYISVTTASGVSNPVVLYVTPYIQTIQPNDGVPGNSVHVILTGYGLGGANKDSFQFSESYVSAQAAAGILGGKVAATLSITGSATPGTVQVSLALGGNTSNQVPFVINNLISMTPTSGMAGQTVPMTLTGVDLTGATITVTGGITVGTPTASSATSITAPFTIPSGASGPQQVTVNIPASGSNPLTFTATPYLASISGSGGVAWGAPGQENVAVTITGSGLTGVTQKGGSLYAGPNIQVSGVQVINDGEVQAQFTVSQNASLGPVSVQVTVPSGNANVTSNPVQFFVASTQPSF